MYLDSEKKKEIFEKYGKSNTDTGSPEAQIALFSYRIAHLTEHLKSNHKDHSTERALKMLVGKRRRLLDYLIKVDINRYRAIIAQKELGIRKQFFATQQQKSDSYFPNRFFCYLTSTVNPIRGSVDHSWGYRLNRKSEGIIFIYLYPLSHTANATQGKSAQCILIPKLKRHFQSSPPVFP